MANEWQPILNDFKKQFETNKLENYKGSMENATQNFNATSSRLAKGASNITSMMARNTAEEQAYAKSQAAEKLKSNFQRTYNKAGGYDFMDPAGNKITPWQYALATQQPLNKVLEGSYDQKDINFMTDYEAMQIDLATNKQDLSKGLKMMSTDYPDIFGGTGKTSRYQMQTNPKVIEEMSKIDTKTNADKRVVDFAKKVKTARNRAEAIAIRDDFMKTGMFRIDAGKNEAKDIIDQLVDTAFPAGPSSKSYLKYLP